MPATQKRPRSLPEPSPSAKAGHPHKVLHLTTYDRLEAYLRAFAEGHFGLLILVGAGGLAKSRSVRAALNGKACWIEGNATPVRHVRSSSTGTATSSSSSTMSMPSTPTAAASACSNACARPRRRNPWPGIPTLRSLERQGIPREFVTKSRVVDCRQRLEEADIVPPLLSAVDPRPSFPIGSTARMVIAVLGGVVSSDGYSAIPRWDRAASLRSRFTSGSSAQRTQRR